MGLRRYCSVLHSLMPPKRDMEEHGRKENDLPSGCRNIYAENLHFIVPIAFHCSHGALSLSCRCKRGQGRARKSKGRLERLGVRKEERMFEKQGSGGYL